MTTSNQLADALSPYLLQHKDNPVHWFAWSEQALALARELDRPILLSIGYSACHWCHVMAHESFEDDTIAEQMNAGFVNIKVDREERPDLDRIYQLAHQLLTGRGGGWPLTVFLDPHDLTPFFAGTYFPARPRYGMIAFGELLARVEHAWREKRAELRRQNTQLRQALAQIQQTGNPQLPDASLPQRMLEALAPGFDAEHGGFGPGPKFPQAPLLNALAGLALRDGMTPARDMLFDTLRAMARSGLCDHLGGGFFRYCVDGRWEIPHFEKMLYDNAQLLPLYAETAVAWDEPVFATAARGIAAWLAREMRLPEGGFCSSLDADNPDGEGAYYVWTPEEINARLDARDARYFTRRYGLDGPPNFEDKHWHLVIRQALEKRPEDEARETVERALAQAHESLLTVRDERTRPGRDDKVIAGWNGLVIAGLCRAGRALDEPEWPQMAEAALAFVCQALFAQQPPHAVWRAGRSGHRATLDDHAGLLLACLEVLQTRFDPRWLEQAQALADAILEHYADPEHGGLYLTPHDHESLIMRPRADADDATPAGAGMAVLGLLRLGHLVAEPRYLDGAENALAAAGGDMQRHPSAHATLISALTEWHQPTPQVLIGGPAPDAGTWQRALWNDPRCRAWRVPPDAGDLPGPMADLARTGPVRAVVCKQMVCLPMVESLEMLLEQLD